MNKYIVSAQVIAIPDGSPCGKDIAEVLANADAVNIRGFEASQDESTVWFGGMEELQKRIRDFADDLPNIIKFD